MTLAHGCHRVMPVRHVHDMSVSARLTVPFGGKALAETRVVTDSITVSQTVSSSLLLLQKSHE